MSSVSSPAHLHEVQYALSGNGHDVRNGSCAEVAESGERDIRCLGALKLFPLSKSLNFESYQNHKSVPPHIRKLFRDDIGLDYYHIIATASEEESRHGNTETGRIIQPLWRQRPALQQKTAPEPTGTP